MNRLKRGKQVAVISALSEGLSVRGTERLTGVHRDTVLRLLVRVGAACGALMDREMRDLPCERVQVDEQWTFVGRKQMRLRPKDDRSRMGDFWIWNAVDADTRLVPTYRLSKRKARDAHAFLQDLNSRLRNRVQLSSDSLKSYVDAVQMTFGPSVDYGMIVKSFTTEHVGPGRYAPPRVSSVKRTPVFGNPDPDHIATSYVERLHLHNRMRCRRLTRLVDSFSRKLENLKAALQLHYAVYNYVKPHKSLGGITPAMASGVTDRFWEVDDLVALASW